MAKKKKKKGGKKEKQAKVPNFPYIAQNIDIIGDPKSDNYTAYFSLKLEHRHFGDHNLEIFYGHGDKLAAEWVKVSEHAGVEVEVVSLSSFPGLPIGKRGNRSIQLFCICSGNKCLLLPLSDYMEPRTKLTKHPLLLRLLVTYLRSIKVQKLGLNVEVMAATLQEQTGVDTQIALNLSPLVLGAGFILAGRELGSSTSIEELARITMGGWIFTPKPGALLHGAWTGLKK